MSRQLTRRYATSRVKLTFTNKELLNKQTIFSLAAWSAFLFVYILFCFFPSHNHNRKAFLKVLTKNHN